LTDVILYQSTEGLRYSASLIPYAQVDVAFRTTGYITEVKQVRSADGRTRDIGTGDYVTKGTVLAKIRRQDLKNQADESGAQVDAAVAQHKQAEQDFNRATTLYATQSLTKPDYDQAQARFDSTLAAVNRAKAAERQAQLSLSDSELGAPLSGYILARNLDVGTLASPFFHASRSPIPRGKATFGVPKMPSVLSIRASAYARTSVNDRPNIDCQRRCASRVFASKSRRTTEQTQARMIASSNLAETRDLPAFGAIERHRPVPGESANSQ
jgi:hypothetical protein